MYLELSQVCFFFERVLEDDFNYFNTEDYRVYSTEEKQVLIDADTYGASVFLLIPQIDRNEIVMKYLAEKNNQNLLQKSKNKDFYSSFHRYTEDNRLVNDWNSFEKSELIQFASVWCEQNQIKFTVK